MKILVYIIIFASIPLSCNNSAEKNDSIVNEKTSSIESDGEIKLIMTSSGSFEPSKEIILDNINYTVVQNNEGKITFWSTRDDKFKTKEGYSVGKKLKEISQTEKERIYKVPGFGYLIELNSGWQLGFCEGKSCTDEIPNENLIVKWIQKRE